MADPDTESELLLVRIILPEDTEKIRGYSPGDYLVRNEAGKKEIVSALSPDRAQALFYMSHGALSPITEVERIGDYGSHTAKKNRAPKNKVLDK